MTAVVAYVVAIDLTAPASITLGIALFALTAVALAACGMIARPGKAR